MSDMILKAKRNSRVEGMEGVVFRHPRYGPVKVVQVAHSRLVDGYEVTLWVTPASDNEKAFLEGCELSLDQLCQSFAANAAAVA